MMINTNAITTPRQISLGEIKIGHQLPLVLIAGPCVIENESHALSMAEKISTICLKLGINFIYKSSFDKANRSSLKGERGVGISQGLRILAKVKQQFGCPVLTDVHWPEQCATVAEVADVLQIPAFLCRQTDLLSAAAQTQRVINVKKGQFMAPWDMPNVINKITAHNNHNILLCERGVSFGYNTLVSDMRSLAIMANTGYPVVFDATHSVQQPGGLGDRSGGQREFVPVLARAAVAVGVAAVFLETHNDPDNAPSDGPNMIPVAELGKLLERLKRIDEIAKVGHIGG